jgi:hypothetical protein
VLLAGWFIYLWYLVSYEYPLYMAVTFAAVYWTVAGAFLTGETAELSPRALRRLPQSFLGRMLFTWFNPGSATGYVFAILNLAALILVITVVPPNGPQPQTSMAGIVPAFKVLPGVEHWLLFSTCILGYVTGYLGLTRLVIIAARRYTYVGMPAVFLCHVIVIGSGILVPLLVQRAWDGWQSTTFTYSLIQIPNWSWTLYDLGRNGVTPVTAWAAATVGTVGGLIFVLNFLLAADEVQHVRQTAPLRVIEDELELHPAAVVRKKRNPWDDEGE